MPAYRYPQPKGSEITPESVFLNRRAFLAGAAGVAAGAAMTPARAQEVPGIDTPPLQTVKTQWSTFDGDVNTLEDIATYNNFYEFGTGKDDPVKNAHRLTTRPWEIKVDGLVNNPGSIGIEDLLAGFPLEERIYRFRCVEAWSMVIPWVGIPLKDVIAKYDVQGSAKYVAFETLVRPEEMIGQAGPFSSLDWPYVEGLRLDEAMHPLTLLAVGVYGREMPNQNGAPVRLVVPWKYGFKSIKSIVRMQFTEEQPPTTWNIQNAAEYGFYSNVNPERSHPRWSQASERRIGSGLFGGRVDTLMMNGYADEVASLYAGMDLQTFF